VRDDLELVVLPVVTGDLRERVWDAYCDAFDELRTEAIQRHVMSRDEFDAVMADERVDVYLAQRDDGRIAGMATLSNDLEAMPLVSPDFFRARWPEHYAARKIWYIGFIAVSPEHQGREAFAQMVEQMYLVVSIQNGLVGLDICSYNDDVRHMSRVFRLMIARNSDNMRFNRIDQQSYWLYEFPSAA